MQHERFVQTIEIGEVHVPSDTVPKDRNLLEMFLATSRLRTVHSRRLVQPESGFPMLYIFVYVSSIGYSRIVRSL